MAPEGHGTVKRSEGRYHTEHLVSAGKKINKMLTVPWPFCIFRVNQEIQKKNYTIMITVVYGQVGY